MFRLFQKFFPLLFIAILIAKIFGCALTGNQVTARANNPIYITGGPENHEYIWERVVDVIHDYRFPINRENKLGGVIETDYRIGSGVLEPWHPDSVGWENRLEATLQSIRRRAFFTITQTDGGYMVGVEVYKELEDLDGIAANSAGGATFQEDASLRRDLDLVVGQSKPSGWILQGRDYVLEQDIANRLNKVFSRQ